MAFIEVKAEFTRLCKAAERIAEALERAYPITLPKQVLPVTEEDFNRITDESLWLKEQEEDAKKTR